MRYPGKYPRRESVPANYKLCPSSGYCKTPRVNQYITRRVATKPQACLKQPREKEFSLLAGHNAAVPASLDSFKKEILFGLRKKRGNTDLLNTRSSRHVDDGNT